MKQSKKTIPLIKWIWRSYLKTALIPLVLVEFVFINIYFLSNNWSMHEMIDLTKTETNESLTQIATLESSVIQEQLAGITHTTQMYANQTAIALEAEVELSPEDNNRLAYNDEGVFYTTVDTGGAAVFYSGYVPIGEAEREKVAKVLQTEELMKSIQHSYPLIASLYLNTHDSLNVIYPYFDVITQYAPHMDIPTYNFYYEADAAHNPTRATTWTDVYLDPAGHGWMASCIAPVYHQDFLEGVVGIDVTVSTITEHVLDMSIPWAGYGILVGDDGTILALPEKGEGDWGLSELTDHSYSEAIFEDTFKPEQFNLYKRENLSTFTEQLGNHKSGLSTIMLNGDPKVVSWNTIEETGWKLILIVSEHNIYESINQTADHLNYIGTLMVVGLIIFYLTFFVILFHRARKLSLHISQPLLTINSMVHNIGNGFYYQESPEFTVEELVETSETLIEMGQQLGNAHHELLRTQEALKENEAYQQILLDSLDDIILEVDETGTILNVRTKDVNNIAMSHTNEGQNTLSSIFNPKEAARQLSLIKRVIETGVTESVEYQLETPKGLRWYQARISLIQSDKNKVVVSARDITERIVMEQSILEAKDTAEKASLAKSQFLSNMSHELRTPLNAVLGFSQLLNMNAAEPLSESQKEFVREIEKAGKHLLDLINEVLDLAKVESGKATISLEPVSVSDIMEDSLAMIKPLAEKNSITIESPVCENRLLYIQADFVRIKQVLINLLSNAVKYNREHGRIDFFCERIDSNLRFHVIDTGYGIPNSEINKIFDPFYRLSNTEQFVEGTGIGLTMVKQLTDMMGGTVFVESVVGKGSHFYVELPLTIRNHFEAESYEKVAVEQTLSGKALHRILYVEDNPANLSLIEHTFQPYPFIDLITAQTAQEGLHLAQNKEFDLILLDIHLPDMSGYDLYHAIRSIPGLETTFIIAISANAMDKDIKKAMEIGFYDYLTKPIDVATFTKKVMDLLFGQNQ